MRRTITKTYCRTITKTYCCCVFLLLAWLWRAMPGAPAPQKDAAEANPANGAGIEMKNVLFRYSPGLAVYIVRLRGRLMPTPGHKVPSFNDPSSYVVAAEAAEMRMNMAQMSALMNDWLLRSPKAKLKKIRMEAQGGNVVIHGIMKMGLHIPFTAESKPSITGDNRIRFTTVSVKAGGVPVSGLMDALGLHMDDLMSQKDLHGMSIDGDAFLIDPQTAFPPPQMRAKLTGVRIEGQSLVILFGGGAPKLSPKPWKNYIAVHGGDVEYGREEMFNAALTLIDTTPADPLEYDLKNYWCQMVAGRIEAQPDRSMRVFVPDYSKLPKGACRQ